METTDTEFLLGSRVWGRRERMEPGKLPGTATRVIPPGRVQKPAF
jgi:hypothetical protein